MNHSSQISQTIREIFTSTPEHLVRDSECDSHEQIEVALKILNEQKVWKPDFNTYKLVISATKLGEHDSSQEFKSNCTQLAQKINDLYCVTLKHNIGCIEKKDGVDVATIDALQGSYLPKGGYVFEGKLTIYPDSLLKMKDEDFWNVVKEEKIHTVTILDPKGRNFVYQGKLLQMLHGTPLKELINEIKLKFEYGHIIYETQAKLRLCGASLNTLMNSEEYNSNTKTIDFTKSETKNVLWVLSQMGSQAQTKIENLQNFVELFNSIKKNEQVEDFKVLRTGFLGIVSLLESTPHCFNNYWDQFVQVAEQLKFDPLIAIDKHVYNEKKELEMHFGSIGEIDPFPAEAFGPSPLDKDKTMIEDFDFFWMPATINGVPVTFNSLEEISKSDMFGDKKMEFSMETDPLRNDEEVNRSLPKGYWYAVHKIKSEEGYYDLHISKETRNLYTPSTIRELIMFAFRRHIKDEKISFGDGRIFRCLEKFQDKDIIMQFRYGSEKDDGKLFFFTEERQGRHRLLVLVRRFIRL
jgi:hypothetical protein